MSEEHPEFKKEGSIYGKPFWLIVIATVTLLMVASIVTNIMIQQENARTSNTRPPETLLERRARQLKEEKEKKEALKGVDKSSENEDNLDTSNSEEREKTTVEEKPAGSVNIPASSSEEKTSSRSGDNKNTGEKTPAEPTTSPPEPSK